MILLSPLKLHTMWLAIGWVIKVLPPQTKQSFRQSSRLQLVSAYSCAYFRALNEHVRVQHSVNSPASFFGYHCEIKSSFATIKVGISPTTPEENNHTTKNLLNDSISQFLSSVVTGLNTNLNLYSNCLTNLLIP